MKDKQGHQEAIGHGTGPSQFSLAAATSLEEDSGDLGPGGKRARTIFTAEQLEQMEQEFQKQQYVVGHERMYLANALNLTEAQVRHFQN